MFLKRLDIHGFKSFADKTSFEFQPGITLVVGPNGSGKSNVADAIRWVLGEQSAKTLRGGKMEDVIFAGSEKRRSLGMAEVSLTIDNTNGGLALEFQEITVTRRLYRSGESEYLINKTPCRLRDLHELFMDTGIGREGFSLIGQGRVEEILLARPDEKRMILEEAAGIIKYRYRKKEAAKKLEETGQHLLRIEDLLLELKAQEEPLARQAEEARAYRILKEELDGLEIGMMVAEIRQADDRLQSLQTELSALEESLLTQRSGFLSAQGHEESLRLALDQAGEQINGLQEDIYRRSLEREKAENEQRIETERSEDLEKQAKTLSDEAVVLEEEWKELSEQWQTRREQEALLAERVDRASKLVEEEEASQKEADAETEHIRQTLDKGDEDHFELLRKDSALQNQEVGFRENLSSAERMKERMAETGLKLHQDLQNVQERIASLEARRTLHQAESAQMEKDIQTAGAALEKAAGEQQAKQQDNRTLAGERGQALSRYKLLEEMEKEGQGYAQGVREILQRRSKERLPGIIGTVAQNLRVDKEYELAVETALGGQAQNIITETERSAQDAIRWLKNFDKGRVTFLPLDTVRNRPMQEGAGPKGKGMIGRLADLVDFEDRLLPAMEFVLGRIWLVDELSNAVARARETGFQYRMVTLDGQMVNAGGSLTGGSVRLSGGGFISRRRQLEELDRDIRQMSRDLVAGEEQEEALRGKRRQANDALEALKEQQSRNGLAAAAVENDMLHCRQEESRLLQEQEMIGRQQEEEEQEQARISAMLDGSGIERKRLAQDIAANRESMEALRQELQTRQSQRANRQSRLTELKVQLAEDKAKTDAFDREGSFLRSRMEQIQSRIASQKENSALSMSRSRQHKEAAERSSGEIRYIDEILIALEEEKKKAQDKRLALQQEAASLDESQKAVSAEIEKKQERRQQLLVQEGRLQVNLEEWKNRMSEQFSLDWEIALETVQPVQEKRRGQQRVKELREELAAMPEVNLAAVTEYEKLLARLELLGTQTEDLRRGKADLEAIISEMDALVSERFKETFDQVNVHFDAIFQRLFAGGRASLVLTQPDNLLETGVDVIAQPPGKKLQHLALLSGGEKALSAISLLMAMLRVRPSPFSILDEIESNLDDANVDRFAELIKEYRDSGSQFIIITHRRGTMIAGDVIYGISAQEFSGVSKVISVRLEEAAK
ncbi:MAG: chromosome segregation protein SMC [Clostridiales bacterium]|nr:chromosome segregation protein SMC [Clostridiales bacterium]